MSVRVSLNVMGPITENIDLGVAVWPGVWFGRKLPMKFYGRSVQRHLHTTILYR